MKWFLAFIIAVSLPVFGQTANDYFHGSAQSYIDSKLDDAIAKVQRGLEIEPDNPKLQALLTKLKEQKEQQQQQQQQQQNQQNQQNQQDQKQDQQNQQNQDQQQKEKQEQQQNQEDQQQQDEEKEKEQHQQPEDMKDQQNPEDQQQQQPLQPNQISKEDAERILQALRAKVKENQKLKKYFLDYIVKKVTFSHPYSCIRKTLICLFLQT